MTIQLHYFLLLSQTKYYSSSDISGSGSGSSNSSSFQFSVHHEWIPIILVYTHKYSVVLYCQHIHLQYTLHHSRTIVSHTNTYINNHTHNYGVLNHSVPVLMMPRSLLLLLYLLIYSYFPWAIQNML